MIYKIYSNLPTFKTIEFTNGLNIIEARLTPTSTEKETRNRTGKTSLIQIIDFMFGAKSDKDSIFKMKEFKNFYFGIEFDLLGKRTVVERCGNNSNEIIVKKGDFNNWFIKPEIKGEIKRNVISNTKWRKLLGEYFFGLKNVDESYKNFKPTFRSLFTYFVRRHYSGGFIDAFSQNKNQKTWDSQIAITYLLGLDWVISRDMQNIRESENVLSKLKSAAKKGAFKGIIDSATILHVKLAVAENNYNRIFKDVNSYKVLPQYHELEKEASQLTRNINYFINQNITNKEYLDQLTNSITIEKPPELSSLQRLFKEAQIVLPEHVYKKIEQVREFHQSVIQNRKSYLFQELEETKRRIEKNDTEKSKLTERRESIWEILRTHGALEHFNKLQEESVILKNEVESIKQRYSIAKQLESKKSELKFERTKIKIRLQQNFDEQDALRKEIVLAFAKISAELYDKPGIFTVEASESGPKYKIEIHGERSHGIKNMQIYCFDMMLMQQISKRTKKIDFIIHDSHLFDGVDERQKLAALRVGNNLSNECNFQYIITFNSDDLPLKSEEFDFNPREYVLPAILTDDEDGGLFGFRFA